MAKISHPVQRTSATIIPGLELPTVLASGCLAPRLLAIILILSLNLAAGSSIVLADETRPASFASLARAQINTVVNITTTQSTSADSSSQTVPGMPKFPPGSLWEEFFRNFRNSRPAPDGQKPPVTNDQVQPAPDLQGPLPDLREDEEAGEDPGGDAQNAASLGSGVIMDPDGYVVTNGHVIAEAATIAVTLHNGRKFSAMLIGTDPATDIALLKLDNKEPLPAAKWGDSDIIEVGDWVVAIGNPFGLGSSVTAGILSARGRDIQQGPYDDYLQTDASINRGNSGGPLFNLDGAVIGINTAIYSPTGGSVGIGFAVPSKIAAHIVTQLRESGTVRRGWLGVQVQRVTPDIAESLELQAAEGALVTTITPEGPAAKAGVEPGDVILQFADKAIVNMRDLPRIVASSEIGEQATLNIRRDKQDRQVVVTVGELEPEAGEIASPGTGAPEIQPPATNPGDSRKVLGLTVARLTTSLREAFAIKSDVKGVMVTEVLTDSDAFARGIEPGDVIIQAGQESVANPDDLSGRVDVARGEDRKTLLLLIDRDGDLRYVPLALMDPVR